MKSRFLWLAALLAFASCEEAEKREVSVVRIYPTGLRDNLGTLQIQFQGSQILDVYESPARLTLWLIDDGKKEEQGTLDFSPEVYDLIYVSPYYAKGTSYIDISAVKNPYEDVAGRWAIEVAFPTPLAIESANSPGSDLKLYLNDTQVRALCWMSGTAGVEMLSNPFHIEAMLAESLEKDISFLAIEASPKQ